MRFRSDFETARKEILNIGIQQTNRYRVFYSKLRDGFPDVTGVYMYPHDIVLPGYGYDFIDHSIWSVIRKIPFRRTYTDLQMTFLVSPTFYDSFFYFWQDLIKQPAITANPVVNLNEELLNNQAASVPDETTIVEGSSGVFGGSPLVGNTNAATGVGGAPNYGTSIAPDYLMVELLDEKKNPKYSLFFSEAFPVQITPVKLTSVETGYSLFTILFKFAKVYS